MKIKIAILSLLLTGLQLGFSQGFVNLNFENTTITTIHNPGGDSYTATIPGWTVNTFNYVNGDPNSIPYNDIALDSPAVNLEGTNSPIPSVRAIQGKYSIFLQGGDNAGSTTGASIGQTGQIPVTAQSITYWGSSLQVAFNGLPLIFNAIGSTPNYTIWGADISAFAGQTGQLLFTTPWLNSGMLDNIQFSTTAVPEPSAVALTALGALLLGFRRWRI
jgi:hypothetical protein